MSEKAPRRRTWRWLLPGLWLLLLLPAWVALFWGGFAGVFAWLGQWQLGRAVRGLMAAKGVPSVAAEGLRKASM